MSVANDQLKQALAKIPFGLLLVLYVGFLAFDLYSFTTDSTSPLVMKQVSNEETKKEIARLTQKVQEANEFYKKLDQKRAELRGLATELDQMKITLSENIDVAAFVKTVVTEAGRTGLSVNSIRPGEAKTTEYYVEQPFELTFKGVYAQFVIFLDRISNLEKVVRVDNFGIRRTGLSTAPYVELNGSIQIKTYKYVGSKADQLAKSGGGA
jgi:Tfp pilus assembly protein PilO